MPLSLPYVCGRVAFFVRFLLVLWVYDLIIGPAGGFLVIFLVIYLPPPTPPQTHPSSRIAHRELPPGQGKRKTDGVTVAEDAVRRCWRATGD